MCQTGREGAIRRARCVRRGEGSSLRSLCPCHGGETLGPLCWDLPSHWGLRGVPEHSRCCGLSTGPWAGLTVFLFSCFQKRACAPRYLTVTSAKTGSAGAGGLAALEGVS